MEAPAVIEPGAVAPVEAAAASETATAALEAAAEGDADAYLLYGYGGHHAYPYHHVYA